MFTSASREPIGWKAAEEVYKPRTLPFDQFKEILFDIYDHRILHAPEISGAVNAAYLPLDEHLILFFLEKNQRRTDAERALVDFLVSLKTFACEAKHQRATLYASMLGFIETKDADRIRSASSMKRQQSMDMKPAEISNSDLYT